MLADFLLGVLGVLRLQEQFHHILVGAAVQRALERGQRRR
jgi:hypothetical protein